VASGGGVLGVCGVRFKHSETFQVQRDFGVLYVILLVDQGLSNTSCLHDS
jgi:hypothetical protein